jgi:hypothetical protein
VLHAPEASAGEYRFFETGGGRRHGGIRSRQKHESHPDGKQANYHLHFHGILLESYLTPSDQSMGQIKGLPEIR